MIWSLTLSRNAYARKKPSFSDSSLSHTSWVNLGEIWACSCGRGKRGLLGQDEVGVGVGLWEVD